MRCATFNIRHGEAGLERIAALLRGWAPDLALLQEVDRGCARSGRVDQAAILAQGAGLHAAFGEAFAFDGGSYGVAVLTRLPARDVRTIALPHAPGPRTPEGLREPRAALVARVGGIVAVSTHLGLDAHERAEQARALRAALEGAGPLVLGGDLNEGPGGAVLAAWRGWLADAYAEAGAREEPTAPPDRPPLRIDFLLRTTTAPRPVRAFLGPEGASDHRAVLVDFEPP